MSPELPVALRAEMEIWLAEGQRGPHHQDSARLTKIYAAGQNSHSVDLSAYVAARMPATFAAISKALVETARLMPHFAPKTLLDIGAGPGTASHAATAQWPSLSEIEMVETDKRFADLATRLGLGLLPPFKIALQPMEHSSAKADLVIAAYVLAEQPQAKVAQTTSRLWQSTQGVLVVVEPGTPEGFARIRAVRQAGLALGAHLVGPCTHDLPCPMAGTDWCHFKVRLARSRAHMRAKKATVPFEDEPYSWVAFSRQPVERQQSRIVRPVVKAKHGLILSLCSSAGLTETTIAARDKPAYKAARHLQWGESISLPAEQIKTA